LRAISLLSPPAEKPVLSGVGIEPRTRCAAFLFEAAAYAVGYAYDLQNPIFFASVARFAQDTCVDTCDDAQLAVGQHLL
jgi:hypothetical protein